MIVLREPGLADMDEAIALRGLCWPEELAGLSDNKIDYEAECIFWKGWMMAGPENDDVRLLYGAFEDGKMLGVAFASFIESKSQPDQGTDLNGLWVYPQYRGRGISIMLLDKLLGEFYELGARKMIVSNFHNSKSNTFNGSLAVRLLIQNTSWRKRCQWIYSLGT